MFIVITLALLVLASVTAGVLVLVRRRRELDAFERSLQDHRADAIAGYKPTYPRHRAV